jgi:putative hemolysin
MELIKTNEVAKITGMNNLVGENAAKVLMSMLKLDKINDVYSKHYKKSTNVFLDSVLDDALIKYHFSENDMERIPATGSFIIVANHPFGGIEGLILLNKILQVRPDFKILGNSLFNRVEPVREYVFGVNPFETKRALNLGIHGLRQAFAHVKNGHPLAIFPAGEVSTWYDESKQVADRDWSQSIIRFIKNAGVPVVPVYFHGSNSRMFHLMGKGHPMLRTARIPTELLNKRTEIIKVRIGNPIEAKEIPTFTDPSEYGRWLRARTYLLEAGIISVATKMNDSFTRKQDISPAVPKNILLKELSSISKDCLLFKFQNFSMYCVSSDKIPNIILEIRRLREKTFRAVGEGTDKAIDIDTYVSYYHQLFIWDHNADCIVGGYRIGKGKEILATHGIKGFYVNSLFRMNEKMKPMLVQSIELGRSFITTEYQRKPLSLFMLWKGILSFLLRNEDYRYLIGPVSISNSYTDLSKKVIVEWIEKNYKAENLEEKVVPRCPFKPMDTRTDCRILVDNAKSTLAVDRLIPEIEPTGHKMPVLLKKYLSIGGKIASFNVDPLFNDSLDGFLLLDIHDVPDYILNFLSKDLNADQLHE